MSFERIKPPDQRLLSRRGGQRLNDPDADPSGRAALFSSGQPSRDTVVQVHCSRCGETSALDAATALRSAVPLFLVAPWRDHPVFAVCPAGGHRAWLRPTLAR